MTDDLHPETGLARIKSGDLSPLEEFKPKRPEATKLISPISPILRQIELVSQIDVTKNRLAAWWNRGQVYQIVELLTQKLLAAGKLRELHELSIDHAVREAKAQTERVLFENQARVAEEATRLGMSPQDYSIYMLESYRAQIAVQKERLEYEETIKLAITQATSVFQYQQTLISQIAQLEARLERVPIDYHTEAGRKAAKREIRALIKSKQGELRASQAESFLQAHRPTSRRLKTSQSEDEGPEEQD